MILVPKYPLRSNKENAYPHLMFSFSNKKVIGVGSSDVQCSKYMEKSEVIQKRMLQKTKNKAPFLVLHLSISNGFVSTKIMTSAMIFILTY